MLLNFSNRLLSKLFTFSSPFELLANFYQLSTKHVWLKGIQDCSKEGFRPFSRGDNDEIVK